MHFGLEFLTLVSWTRCSESETEEDSLGSVAEAALLIAGREQSRVRKDLGQV